MQQVVFGKRGLPPHTKRLTKPVQPFGKRNPFAGAPLLPPQEEARTRD